MTDSLNEADFRHCLGCFATGVTIITIKNPDGALHGITINSFSSLSLNPALILFNLDKKSHSYNNFINAENFAVNILAESQIDLSKQFTHPSSVDWDKIKHSTQETNCPIFEGNIAYIECKKHSIHEGGDHSIFTGKVLNLKQLSNEKPLLYYKGQYNKISEVS